MLESAARSVLGANAMAPCDDLTKQRIRETLESVLKSGRPGTDFEVLDRNPKTLEERVAFALMDEDYAGTMHVEVRIRPSQPAEYVTMTLNLPAASASVELTERDIV